MNSLLKLRPKRQCEIVPHGRFQGKHVVPGDRRREFNVISVMKNEFLANFSSWPETEKIKQLT